MMYEKYLKRLFDIVFSLITLILLLPVFAAVCLLVRLRIGSPVLFKQKRPGRDERLFTLYKFRTMTDGRDENGGLMPEEKRLTGLGRVLRRTSLDELPQLINILRGDMSFVGPRPLLCEYLPLYDENQRKRHSVRPGLTGLAQVSGRNSIDWAKKFALDVKYTEDVTFCGDVKIVFLTVAAVLTGKGVTPEGSETVEPFKGNRKDE